MNCIHPWIFFFFFLSHAVCLISIQYNKQKTARFLQKGFFDAFDRDDETIFDTTFRGYCSSFSPPYTQKKIQQDWIQQKNDWSYEDDNTVLYSGRGESQVKPFWLWFWKYPRYCLTPALIKNNYFCQNSQITAQVQLDGASEAGIVFRARGTFDFWSLMLTRSSVVLIWFYQGERKEIKKCPYNKSDWTLLHIAEEIGSVTVFCGDNIVRHNVTHTLQDINEIADEHMGAAGLVSYGGKARFRYVVLGEVDWTPDPIKKSKQNRQKKKNINNEEQVLQSLEDEDISSSLSDLLSWCPNPSLCGNPPYKIYRRPQNTF